MKKSSRVMTDDYKFSVGDEARQLDISNHLCANDPPRGTRAGDWVNIQTLLSRHELCLSQLPRRSILVRIYPDLVKGEELNMLATDVLLLAQLDRFIAGYKLRIQQQRIHARELSAAPMQQKHAQAQLLAMRAGLAKLL